MAKKVLFISNSYYDFKKQDAVLHLQKKFEGLSRGEVRSFVLAKGRPSHKKIWGAEFCLLSNKFLFELLAFRMGFWLCLTKRIDVIIAQSPLLEGFTGALLKKFFRKKQLIVEAHGDWDSIFLVRKRRLEKLQKKIVKFFVKTSFKSADKVRVVAKYLLTKTQKLASDKPHFIFPTFTDLDIFLNTPDTCFEPFILFVGGLYKIKGVKYLIEAFKRDTNLRIHTNDTNREAEAIKLVIVGEGPETEKLKVQSEKLKVAEKIEFKGRLSLEQTRDIMKKCYCLVVPSLSEGLPRVILEAMALAKPVIASNIGGIPDIIKNGQNGFLFAKGNADDLAQKLKILLADENLAIKMGQNGRGFVSSNFSNAKYIDNYIKMINS